MNGELTAAVNTGIPGFFLAGNNSAQVAISALQALTQVRVLSSPQLSSTRSPISRPSVIMNVTRHVNSGGLVTLDISQQVSQTNPSITSLTTGINSPALSYHTVRSRAVVQDGDAVGLAGLIQDSVSHGNTGFPIFKDIPLLGVLFSQQDNTSTRTELLVLVIPHVMHDQRDAGDPTEDMHEQISGSAVTPAGLKHLRQSGLPDPPAPLLNRIKSVS